MPHPYQTIRDGLDFRVRSQIVIEASPVMDAQLSNLQSSTPGGDLAHTLDIAEDSSTLELLLRLCYPIANPPLNDISVEDLEIVLRAALKYDMELPVAMLAEELMRRAKHVPLSIWSVACRAGQEGVARRAAEHMLALASLDLKSFDNLTGITAGQLYRLREFRRLQGAVDESFRFGVLPRTDTANGPTFPPPYTFALPGSAPTPDLTLQSSDEHTYSAHRNVICMISTILCRRINANLRHRTNKSNKSQKKHHCTRASACIELEDAGSVLSALLAFCYRLGSSVLDTFPPSTLAATIAAANKYDMHGLLPELRAQWALVSKREPLRSYFAAAELDLSEFATQSARDVLRIKLDGCYLPEMEDTSAETYRRVLIYHEACQAVARTLLVPLQLAAQPESPQSAQHPDDSPRHWRLPPTPLDLQPLGLLNEIIKVYFSMAAEWPGRLELCFDSPYELATRKGLWCPSCQSSAQKLTDLSGVLREAPYRFSQVPFPS
ncbi:hypothetical protein GY45DRAFT_681407 [Cubamyces sp. BRFM 1775]|nr:hypothetical protein GY45DRAFT_681407 [Cubamyces sp. BRFM 1775]